MKRIDLRWVAMAALVFGLGFGASAAASDPGCYSTCQELMNDCRAQAPPGNPGDTQHCNRLYRECLAGCEVN
ncbi:hypothetical protein [Lysobacter capsici]|uniref:hypothetical protein n=1 Tax=Lysobacter capsici TaxID=435897 RepID=UPI0012FD13ED|nr:hypothetical protein [Lysobacter capsici]